MTYRASLTAPADARAAMVELWSQNLPIQADQAREKFDWFYLGSPGGPASAFLLRDDGGAGVIGCSGVGMRTLHYQGRELNAALLADLAVDRRHRSGYPAITLQRTVRRHTKGAFDLAYGYPNVHAVALHVKLGFHPLGKMERYARVSRHQPYVARRTTVPLAPAVLGATLDLASGAAGRARSARPRLGRKLVLGDVLDARFDDLWASAKSSWPIACRRDAAFLRWRHTQRPGKPSVVVTVSRRTSRELTGYAIVRETERASEIVDLFAQDQAELDNLVALLVPALARLRAPVTTISFLGTKSVPDTLRAHGFELREATRSVIVDPGETLALSPDVWRDAGSYYLTDADEDV